jgi:hypothetical protein
MLLASSERVRLLPRRAVSVVENRNRMIVTNPSVNAEGKGRAAMPRLRLLLSMFACFEGSGAAAKPLVRTTQSQEKSGESSSAARLTYQKRGEASHRLAR